MAQGRRQAGPEEVKGRWGGGQDLLSVSLGAKEAEVGTAGTLFPGWSGKEAW